MANIITNTMRYGVDEFSFRKQGLLKAKVAFDCENVTNVEGFNFKGVQPADCSRRMAFEIDSIWYKLSIANGIGSLSKLPTQDISIESLLSEGNTVEELVSVTSIEAFVGKQIYTAIALDAPPNAEVMPSLSVELKTRNNQDQFQKEEYSAEYELAEKEVSIVSVTFETACTGQANAAIMVSLKQSGQWSGWMEPISAKEQKGSAIKFKAIYTVTTLDGTDTAKVSRVSCIYCNSNAYVSGSIAEILTVTADYEKSLKYVRAHVKHKKTMDAEIKAYVSFRKKPKNRELLNVGTGTAQRQLIQLEDSGINHNTLQLFFDGKPTYNFDYNTELSQILCIAPENTNIAASYQYGWEKEEWREINVSGIQPQQESNDYTSSFSYELPDDETDQSISVVKVELFRPNGSVRNEKIGIGTGKKQLFVLPHFAKKESIECTASFSYDDSSRILTAVAEKDREILVSYDWIAETHELSGLVVAWNE